MFGDAPELSPEDRRRVDDAFVRQLAERYGFEATEGMTPNDALERAHWVLEQRENDTQP